MRKRFGYLKALLVISMLLGASSLSALEIKNDAQLEGSIAKMRMMVWRTLKDHIMIGMDSVYGNPQEEIKKTLAAYDVLAKAINAYVKDPALKKHLLKIEKRWGDIETCLDKKLTLPETEACYQKIVAFETSVNKALEELDSDKGIIIAEAGYLRALSQILPSEYALKAWGMKGADTLLLKSMKRLHDTLELLKKDPATGPKMLPLIRKIEKIELFLQVMADSETMTPHLLHKKGEAMLKDAGALTQLYTNKLK